MNKLQGLELTHSSLSFFCGIPISANVAGPFGGGLAPPGCGVRGAGVCGALGGALGGSEGLVACIGLATAGCLTAAAL